MMEIFKALIVIVAIWGLALTIIIASLIRSELISRRIDKENVALMEALREEDDD